MKIEDMHKDIHKALIEDEKYKQFMNAMEDEEEKKQLSEFMKRFMGYFQEKMFNPLQEKMEDQEFKDAIYQKFDSIIPNKGKDK